MLWPPCYSNSYRTKHLDRQRDGGRQFAQDRHMSVNRMNRPRPTHRNSRPALRQSQYHSSDLLRKRPYGRWIFRRLLRIDFLSFRQPAHVIPISLYPHLSVAIYLWQSCLNPNDLRPLCFLIMFYRYFLVSSSSDGCKLR